MIQVKTRTLAIAVAVLSTVLVLLGWRHFQQHRQIQTAAFLTHHCWFAQKHYIDEPHPQLLASRLDFLITAYEYRSRVLDGSPLAADVERDYQRTLTNAVALFRRTSTNDLGDDPKVWLKHFAP